MAIPDYGTPEGASAEQRIETRLRGLAFFATRKLGGDPSKFHILFRDVETGEKVAAFANGGRNEGQVTNIRFESAAVLPSQETVLNAVDILLQTNPGIPMIYDDSVLNELRGDSLQTIGEEHFRLTGHPNGDLDVYVPSVVSV